ncbi:MAG TPA: flagellar basal body P-ring protein FlgI [Terriglobales bacterium]|nr:flagellar basal body P-ring protein FlgI [Terriglobales bacterium]
MDFRLLIRGWLGGWSHALLLLAAGTCIPPAAARDASTPLITKTPPPSSESAQPMRERVLLRDITTIEGVRSNPLVGYGLVIGLNGTGDRRQTFFTTQTLANIMQRMGVQIPASAVRVNNIAAVFVTGTLPPFARSGTTLDVNVASVGDAKSLEGGVLLLTPLQGPDGRVYASAQGPLTLGGYSAGGSGNTKQVNHPTVGQVANGATVERDTALDLTRMNTISFMLQDADFTASRDVAEAIDKEFGRHLATAIDSRRIDVSVSLAGPIPTPELISKVQNLSITFHPRAKVVINERTGTIVLGGDVKLSAVSVLHGNLTIDVVTTLEVSQPQPFAKGDTTVVPDISIHAKEGPVGKIQLPEGARVEDLVSGLHEMGATARDVVAILQAIKAAGGLRAELEVL